MTGVHRLTFPVYVFARTAGRGDGVIGTLHFNTFGRRPKMRARREITEIIAHLTAEAQAGRIPADGVVVGWPADGRKPVNVVDTSDEEVMRSWVKRAFKLSLQVDLRSDDANKALASLKPRADGNASRV
jgi:hypothetical protein